MEELQLQLAGARIIDKRRESGGVSDAILAEALARVREEQKNNTKITVDLGRYVSVLNLITLSASDKVIWLSRPQRAWKTPFVLRTWSEPTSKVTLVFGRSGDSLILLASYFGEPSPPEPMDASGLAREPGDHEENLANARAFWGRQENGCPGTHALRLGTLHVCCSKCGGEIGKGYVIEGLEADGRVLHGGCKK